MDAHEREAGGAAVGMMETYGTTFPRPRKHGDYITFTLPAWPKGEAEVGLILGIDDGIYTIETETDVHEIIESDIVSL
jgi:hypothetical protein